MKIKLICFITIYLFTVFVIKLPCLTSKDECNCNCRMSSNKALGYYDDHQAPLVDWDWASPAIQAYSTANDLYKVRHPLYCLKSRSLSVNKILEVICFRAVYTFLPLSSSNIRFGTKTLSKGFYKYHPSGYWYHVLGNGQCQPVNKVNP